MLPHIIRLLKASSSIPSSNSIESTTFSSIIDNANDDEEDKKKVSFGNCPPESPSLAAARRESLHGESLVLLANVFIRNPFPIITSLTHNHVGAIKYYGFCNINYEYSAWCWEEVLQRQKLTVDGGTVLPHWSSSRLWHWLCFTDNVIMIVFLRAM